MNRYQRQAVGPPVKPEGAGVTESYLELLRHPLWQKKRLEVLQAAAWRCQCCNTKDEQLHAHHIFYRKGAKPWEYHDGEIIALCDECHTDEHDFGDSSWQYVKRRLVGAGCFHGAVSSLADGFNEGVNLAGYEWPALGKCIEMILERRNLGTDLSDLAREIEKGGQDKDAGRDDVGYDRWVAAGMPDVDWANTRVVDNASLDGNPF